MDKVGIALIALLLTAIIIGPLFCASLTRGNKPRVYNPHADDINEACRKLKSVTTRSSVANGNGDGREVDLEAATPQAELGECPVCIGPLIPEPAHTTQSVDDDGAVRSRLEEVATMTPKALPKSSGECVVEIDNATSNPTPEAPTHPVPSEDDILTLKSCGHSFHSKCLSSWFLIKRYDCPVCRVPYYKSHPRTSKALNITALSRVWAP